MYLVGPVAGMLIAVGFAYVLRGRGGDVISRAAGSGVLDEGAQAARAQLSQDIEHGRVVPPGIAAHRRTAEQAMTGAALTLYASSCVITLMYLRLPDAVHRQAGMPPPRVRFAAPREDPRVSSPALAQGLTKCCQ